MENNTRQPELLLTVEAVAVALSLGRGTIYQMITRGEIPCVRLGRAVRIRRDLLDSWIEERTNA